MVAYSIEEENSCILANTYPPSPYLPLSVHTQSPYTNTQFAEDQYSSSTSGCIWACLRNAHYCGENSHTPRPCAWNEHTHTHTRIRRPKPHHRSRHKRPGANANNVDSMARISRRCLIGSICGSSVVVVVVNVLLMCLVQTGKGAQHIAESECTLSNYSRYICISYEGGHHVNTFCEQVAHFLDGSTQIIMFQYCLKIWNSRDKKTHF